MFEVAFLVRGGAWAHAPLWYRDRVRLALEGWRGQTIRSHVCRARALRAASLRLLGARAVARTRRAAARLLAAWRFHSIMQLDWPAFMGRTESEQGEEDEEEERFEAFGGEGKPRLGKGWCNAIVPAVVVQLPRRGLYRPLGE
jgi:hypothetical protein